MLVHRVQCYGTQVNQIYCEEGIVGSSLFAGWQGFQGLTEVIGWSSGWRVCTFSKKEQVYLRLSNVEQSRNYIL